MIATIKYLIFIGLFTALLSLTFPAVTQLPFGLDAILVNAVGGAKALIYYVPFLQVPWQLFQFTLQLAFYFLMFWVIMLFITSGGSGTKHK